MNILQRIKDIAGGAINVIRGIPADAYRAAVTDALEIGWAEDARTALSRLVELRPDNQKYQAALDALGAKP